LPILHAIVLGIVQGLTEFFPVSSSGHLTLVPWLFGWDDFNGNDSLQKTFDVGLHLGTLVGAVAYFRKDLVIYAREGLRTLTPAGRAQVSADGRIAWLLVASMAPAAITGVLLEQIIEKLDDKIWLIAVMLIAFGLVLLVADRLGGDRTLDQWRLRDALLMGLGQAFALMPGVSRSGVTITVGRAIGFDRNATARLSFLMSLPIIAGAGVFKFSGAISDGAMSSDFIHAFLWGMVAAALTGWAAVWATIRLVSARSFAPFTVYRIIAGLGVLALLATGYR